MMRSKFLIIFSILFFNCLEQTNAQNNTVDTSNIHKELLRNGYFSLAPKDNKPDNREKCFFNMGLTEVFDTTQNYSKDFGNLFSYYGNVVGGIKNLLQTKIHTTPNVRFSNLPAKNRYVHFYGHGLNMSYNKLSDTAICGSNDRLIDGRIHILNMLSYQFDFTINKIYDSVDIFKLKTIDKTKLDLRRTPQNKQYLGGWGRTDSLSKDYISECAPLMFLSWELERKWNILNEEETGTEHDGYDFRISKELLDSPDRLSQLNQYLADNLGLLLEKQKIWHQVFLITFK